jgi:hypothetical protein
MNSASTPLGGMFLLLALLFLIGLLNPCARRCYPSGPGVIARSAAPLIFACLAIACFRGNAAPALLFVVVAGVILRGLSRRKNGTPR